jgi:hypothetical protein
MLSPSSGWNELGLEVDKDIKQGVQEEVKSCSGQQEASYWPGGSMVLQNFGILPHHYMVSSLFPTGMHRALATFILTVTYLCLLPGPTHSILKIEGASFSEMLLSYHIPTWHHNPEDHDLSLHHHKNLKSCPTSTEHFIISPQMIFCTQAPARKLLLPSGPIKE